MKWLTSGAHRLKASLNRSFGARKKMKSLKFSARSTSIFASAKIGARERMSSQRGGHSTTGNIQRMSSQPIQRIARDGRVLRPSRPMNAATAMDRSLLQQELRRQDTHGEEEWLRADSYSHQKQKAIQQQQETKLRWQAEVRRKMGHAA